MGVEYPLTSSEDKDVLHLSKDMTFKGQEEGRKVKGKWRFNAEEGLLVLTNENDAIIKMFKIEQANKKELVCKVVTDWEYDMTVYMEAPATSFN